LQERVFFGREIEPPKPSSSNWVCKNLFK
jgi:hypothetical protein